MLRGGDSGYSDDAAAGTFGRFRRGAVALPQLGGGRVDLRSVADPDLQRMLDTPEQILRPDAQRNLLLCDAPAKVACDPTLRQQGRDYGFFLSSLLGANVIEVGPSSEEVGIFFALKKSGDLRLIFDARRANCWCHTPLTCSLPSGESLAAMSIPPDSQLHMAGGDVECCFYQCALPEAFRHLFGLMPVEARFLDKAWQQRLNVSGHHLVQRRVRVVPMGWSWATCLIQRVHLHHFGNLPVQLPWVVDKMKSANFGIHKGGNALYIDNFACFATDAGLAQEQVDSMKAALAHVGVVSSLGPASDTPTFIGFELVHHSRWRPTPKKCWRAVLGLRHLLNTSPLVCGRDLEHILGHLIHIFTLKRELLSIFNATYSFIKGSYLRRQPLWASVVRELRWVLALLPLVEVDIQLPWRTEVHCYDASPWGFGVTSASWALDVVRELGAWSERSRLKGPWAVRGKHRERALGSLEASSEGFEDIPHALLVSTRWKEKADMGYASHRVLSRRVLAATSGLSSSTTPTAPVIRRPTHAPSAKRKRGPCRPPRVSAEIRELAPWLTPLQAKRVQTKTRLAYSQLLVALAMWLNVAPFPKLNGEQWGAILVDFLEDQLDRSMTLSMAVKTVSAVLSSRPPLPIECVTAIAARLAAEGDLLMALFVWVSFETYWRPSEGLALLGYQVLPGLPGGSGSAHHLSFLVRPSEQETPTKTGLFDVSIVLDLPRQQFLVPLLLAVKHRVRDSGLMFPISHMEARSRFQAAAIAVNVGSLRPTLYSLRHGGASHDRASNSRSAHDVTARGLWRSSNSVLRCEKHSRLARQLHALPAAARHAVTASYRGAANAFTALFWKHWPAAASQASQLY
ncbi:unnamed protein product [Prorocentrum cordatum]|uniref:Reverse transcriptase domain-containing protein n=1 Tax=Prorocentrum cordatum TaxID=2364126 RepID=A0ABN9QV75_9DINO|nr:unnamed protein product [Polarella glacialis]